MTDIAGTLPFDQPDPLQPPVQHAVLREHEPVAAVRTADGREAWLVTSYELVSEVLTDQRFGVVPPGVAPDGNASLLQDGDPHRRLRRLVGPAFSPRRLAGLQPEVARLARSQANSFAAGGAPSDLVGGFAAPLSIAVISEVLGVALPERDRFRALTDAASRADFMTEDGGAAWGALAEHIGELLAAKERELADDLFSDLIRARDAGELNAAELAMLALAVLAAGYLTATNAIVVGTLLLIAEDRFADLSGASGDHLAGVVEEVVRLQIGVIGEVFPRWARTDVELGGVSIAAGDQVLARLGAANRDPGRFDEPEQLVPDRFGPGAPVTHLAFGRGPHHCLGAALARVEIGAALQALASALPTLRLAGSAADIEWSGGAVDTGPVTVTTTW